MKVQTRKEYEAKKSEKKSQPEKNIREKGEEKSERKVTSPLFPTEVYILFDPESRTFEDIIEIDGVKYPRRVEMGKLMTIHKVVSDYLVRCGWSMVAKEIYNGEIKD